MSSLDYNEGKVLRGVAELVGYANLKSLTREDIYALFDRYERGSYYATQERSFHASVNPSETDGCSQEEVLSFISGLMERLGYGEQPYLVYRHFDIDREHYHVVSVRINGEGRKINNYYEKRRASAYMREVARRFAFTVPEKGERVRLAEDLTLDGAAVAGAFRFNPRREVLAQMKGLFARALAYDADTLQELLCILEDFGVRASLIHPGEAPELTLQGLDRKGAPVTRAFTETELGVPLYSRFLEGGPARREAHRRKYREKERVRGLVGFAYEMSRSEGHFVNILRGKNIRTHMHRTKESGDIFGVTFVDHSTRTVFKASELREVISVRKMQEAVSSGKWRPEDRGRGRSSYVRQSRAAAREDALRLRDLHAGVVARVLKPVGQPKGASWSGKTQLTREGRRQEWDAGRAGAMDASFEDRRYEEKLK